MKKIYSTVILLFFALSLNAQERRVIILHTNDMHSRLAGFAPESAYTPLTVNDDKTIGGFARIATLIKDEKKNKSQVTVVIDAGDFLMGTLFHTIEAETGFQLPLMKMMGYDIVAMGNHEFDFGPAVLAQIINNSVRNGEIPELMLGNAVFSASDDSDNSLEELFTKGIIKRTFVKDFDGIKIGFFSLMGVNADKVAPRAKPVTFSKQTDFARKAVSELKAKGCEIIICISHSGVVKDKDGNWAGEDVDLAKNVKGINLIISGHTHTRIEKPFLAAGIPVVQAGEYGEFVGKIVLAGSNGEYRLESYNLLPVDDRIRGDKLTDDLIRGEEEKIAEKILRPMGMEYSQPVVETSVEMDCNQQENLDKSNLGPLVADAIHFYLNHHSSSGDDVSMVSAGVIRDRIMPGVQSAADIFRIMPLGSGQDSVPGYALSRLYITGRELKNLIEILLKAQESNSDYHCFYSGLKIEYDPSKGMLKKISRIDIVRSEGQTINVDFSKRNRKLYSIAANSYMLQFVGIIKKKTHGFINIVPKDKEGKKVSDMKSAVVDIDENNSGIQEGKEWLALIEYLRQMKDKDGNGVPDLDKKYFTPVKSFTTVKR